MKILTKEEEDAHYDAVVTGGIKGGLLGLAVGGLAVFAGSRRFHTIQHLTLPMKTFLWTSSGTFAAIINADRASRSFELQQHPEEQRIADRSARQREELTKQQTPFQRFVEWGRVNRYSIVGGSWVASMGTAFYLVNRNPYLTKAQKIVQARVYAQGLTVAILLATAAFELGDAKQGKGRWETVKIIDPNDPEHKRLIEKKIHHESYEGEDLWMDMVAAEEKKMKQREEKEKKEQQEQKEQKEATSKQ